MDTFAIPVDTSMVLKGGDGDDAFAFRVANYLNDTLDIFVFDVHPRRDQQHIRRLVGRLPLRHPLERRHAGPPFVPYSNGDDVHGARDEWRTR